MRRVVLAAVASAALATGGVGHAEAADTCRGTIYLSFDTGSQSQAEFVAQTLVRHRIKATFFLANEKTVNGDYSLDPAWAPYWKARLAEGHAFGTHTFDHVYVQRDLSDGRLEMKPQFGPNAGKKAPWTPAQYCTELKRVDHRFQQLTGAALDPIWRAPGGRLTPGLRRAGEQCGYRHVGWAPAGFSGDELSSDAAPNATLLKKSLDSLKSGDIFVAHLGIWSRKDPWAPAVLEPLISGLEKKGFCFATLRDHPDFRDVFAVARKSVKTP
ncbi:MAG: polysaccharide deacetylase family protein [Herminiimonas sp.]|nr:polysaccharide deacetylase family protein [Herminiimonas sp.]